MDIVAIATKLFNSNGMVFSFMLLGIIMYFAYKIGKLTHGRIHGSAIAIFFGLVLAYIALRRHGPRRRRYVQRFRYRFHRIRC